MRTFTESLCGCKKGTPCDCLSYVNLTSTEAVQHVINNYDSYFVFYFSRNVLRRAISQYQVRHPCPCWQDNALAQCSTVFLAPLMSTCLRFHLLQYLTALMDPACPAPSYMSYCQDPYFLGDICQLNR